MQKKGTEHPGQQRGVIRMTGCMGEAAGKSNSTDQAINAHDKGMYKLNLPLNGRILRQRVSS